MASSPGGHRDDLCSPGGVTGQDAVVEHRVPARRGHQGGQPLEELAGAQHHGQENNASETPAALGQGETS